MANSKKITGYTGTATEISIPTSIGGSLVREIGADAFKDKGITKITLDAYTDDIAGKPWGATGATIVWSKETPGPGPTPTEIDITWDGDTTGKTVITPTGYDSLYKVSDQTATLEQASSENAYLKMEYNNNIQTVPESKIYSGDGICGICTQDVPELFSVSVAGATAMQMTFPETGTYVVHTSVSSAGIIQYTTNFISTDSREITYNGNYEGKTKVIFSESEDIFAYYIKVSDEIFTESQLLSQLATHIIQKESITPTTTDCQNGWASANAEAGMVTVACALTDGATILGVSNVSKGIYFATFSIGTFSGYISKLHIS